MRKVSVVPPVLANTNEKLCSMPRDNVSRGNYWADRRESIDSAGARSARQDRLQSSTEGRRVTSERLPRVQIVDREHPHFEEYGRLTGKVIRPVWAKPDGSGDMAEVALENCQHGTDGCFVSKGQAKQVRER